MLSAAVVLQPEGTGGALSHLIVDDCSENRSGISIAPAEFAEGFSHNPQAGMADLVDAIQRGQTGTLALDRGNGRGYRVTLDN